MVFVFAAMSYLGDHMRALLLSHSLMTRFIAYGPRFCHIPGFFNSFSLLFLWLEREESSVEAKSSARGYYGLRGACSFK